MTSNPILSIIVPIYNTGKYLRRCIDSLLNQSYKNIEIILINDGSTDDSDYIINTYYKKLPQIEYIKLENNKGLGNARNTGIQLAKGNYITFVDSDDWVDLDLYKMVMNNLLNGEADIAVFGVKNEFENLKTSSYRYKYLFENMITAHQALGLLTKEQNNNYFISTVVWNKIYKSNVIKEHNLLFLDNSYWEDDIFSFEVLLNIDSVLIVPDIYYHYYNRPTSITNNISKKHIDDLIFSFNHLNNKLKEEGLLEKYSSQFKALFDKCICFLGELIFKNESNVSNQKKYISYLIEELTKVFTIKEIIDYLDIQRLKHMFF